MFYKLVRCRDKLKRFFRSKLVILLVFVSVVMFLINDVKLNEKTQRNQMTKAESDVFVLDDGISEKSREIIELLGLSGPGEHGDPVLIPENISEALKAQVREAFEENKFNAFASSLISLNRRLPDVRSEACRAVKYSENLSKCSIVISFHNENRKGWKVSKMMESRIIRFNFSHGSEANNPLGVE